MSDDGVLTDEQKEGANFLDRDFNQCFQQMQYYDGQIVDICKFAFTGYATIVGAALTLYKYGTDKGSDFRSPAVSLLVIGLLFGLCLLALMVRNRVYFVVVTRYVNEHRQHFLAQKPLGFENKSRMFTNPTQPPYFDWRSSQAILLYALALLNAALLGVGLYLVYINVTRQWTILTVASALFLIAQLAGIIGYLLAREGKSASEAVFGQE
ncbi:MAG TPA: hypothetical protein VFN26_04030 [Candidatus Acidoferrum sp.]|nr:hypothetical protein [Candidatus Acidoferrum sp.]